MLVLPGKTFFGDDSEDFDPSRLHLSRQQRFDLPPGGTKSLREQASNRLWQVAFAVVTAHASTHIPGSRPTVDFVTRSMRH